MKYSHLLFDLDNTILNFSSASLEALKDVSEVLQLEYNQEFLDVYHRINHGVWKEFEHGMIDSLTLRRKRFEETANHFGRKVDGLLLNRKYIKGIINHAHFMPGAEELLHKLKENYSINIITNGLKEAQRPRLKEANIYHLFDTITVSDEIGFAKPHFKYFDYAWNKISSPNKAQVLVIGDSLNSDITGGNNFGFQTCLYDPKGLFKHHNANFKVNSLQELQKILLK